MSHHNPKACSQYTALIMLTDKIMNSLNNGDIVLGLFLDFSKAFDSVNHDILKKLIYNRKNINELIFTLNQELKHLVEWLEANKLFLNTDKTHFMIFS